MRQSILLLLNAFLALAVSGVSAAADETTATWKEQMVVWDGYGVRVRFSGLENRKADKPVVVFEAGATQSLDAWGSLLNDIAADLPVVAYDRAGLGQSEWDDEQPTPLHVANRLHRLLMEIGVNPPFVLVGYSWGGALSRYFAGYYPAEVAGLVYVDPGPIVTQSPDEELAPFNAIGAGRAGYDAFWSGYGALVEQISPAASSEFDVMSDLMARNEAERDLWPVPDVPAVVIVAAKPNSVFLDLPYDQATHFQFDLRHRVRMLQEWALASSQGTLVVSNHTSHAVIREDPGLIIWAIERVLAAAQAGRKTGSALP